MSAQPNTIFEPQPNKPAAIALASITAQPCRSPHLQEDRWQYRLTDGRLMFLPPAGKNAIEDARIETGQRFNLNWIKTAERETWRVVILEPPRKNGNNTLAAPDSLTTATGFSATAAHIPRKPVNYSEHSTRDLQAPSPSLMTVLGAMLIAADEACATAENHAEAHGRVLRYTSEDRRAIAISCFISRTQRRAG